MPRGFTEQEKAIIRGRLKEKGQWFFETYGLRKTNVEELTRAVGISKGAFYLFYESKEELFFDILEQLEGEFRERAMENIFKPGRTDRESIRDFLLSALQMMDENPIFRLFTGDDYQYLTRKLPPERLDAHLKNDEAVMEQFIRMQPERFAIHDAKLAANLIKALLFVTFHKADFGEGDYEKTIHVMADLVASYLIRE
jgi:AcrR family transcriptional regulator